MTQVTSRFIANNAVNQDKIRLANNSALKARNNAGDADVEIVKVNASDKIEFLSVPQVTADAVAANDLIRKSQFDAALQGLKPKAAVKVMTTGSNVDLATGGLLTIDDVVLVAGDRVLVRDQTDPKENGIYVAAAGAWSRAVDMDVSSEFSQSYTLVTHGTANAGKGQICTVSSSFVLDTDDVTFILFYQPGSLGAGDMISVAGSTISVDLAAVSGLESTNPGNNDGKLRVKLEASNPSLQIDGSNQLGVKLPAAGAIENTADGIAINLEASNPSLEIVSTELGVKVDSAGAIVKGASGIAVQLQDTNPSLEINTNKLEAKVNAAGAIEKSASGLAVKIEASNPTLQISSNELGVKINSAGGLETSASGVQVNVDATNGSTSVNGSNELVALKQASEKITLVAQDITNQYVDLAKKAYSADSISLVVLGGLEQEQAVDYSVTLDQGGVTRISFLGDLATGGAIALIADDKLVIKYSWL